MQTPGGKDVIVADDEEGIRRSAKLLLSKQPNIGEVTSVASGQALIDAVMADKGGQVRLVLSDVSMPIETLDDNVRTTNPGISGLAAAQTILERKSDASPLFVFQSGGMGEADVERAMSLLQDDQVLGVLCKNDFSWRDLAEMVDVLCSDEDKTRLAAIAWFANQTRASFDALFYRSPESLPERFRLQR